MISCNIPVIYRNVEGDHEVGEEGYEMGVPVNAAAVVVNRP
jgi:hypothetical protein